MNKNTTIALMPSPWAGWLCSRRNLDGLPMVRCETMVLVLRVTLV